MNLLIKNKNISHLCQDYYKPALPHSITAQTQSDYDGQLLEHSECHTICCTNMKVTMFRGKFLEMVCYDC